VVRVLLPAVGRGDPEPRLTIEKDETLWCTPKGQVADLKPRTVWSFTAEKAKALAAKRGDELAGERLKTAVAAVLKLPEGWNDDRRSPPDYRILRPVTGRKYPLPHATTYAVETEPGVFAVVYRLSEQPHLSRPSRDRNRAVLYVSHHSADVELRDEPLIAEVMKAEPGSTVYACDVRGIGESRPDTCGVNTFLNPYGCDYFYAAHSLMLDRPYPGRRRSTCCGCSTGSRTSGTARFTWSRRGGARSRRRSWPCCRGG